MLVSGGAGRCPGLSRADEEKEQEPAWTDDGEGW